ncbi:hypothetical protein HG535_0H04070 [Zygotorulaspora mrakii]|uniref:MINDY deubiquitinase domain-containing protein n=1 Tax=Zygotorulaspora mrakii TaxID=42260 RepID=A0A7H9B9E7_ZYGMR|nr:uncharacterized protein HG535_0H04070 [Zygotorulaspora mrakii]QLG75080.1 hypothetical protein HG535_0H04070 [Zygotorulaspora mrakii]
MSLSFATKNIQINGTPYRILLQNDNGPCALVALANVLLLSPSHQRKAQELVRLVDSGRTIALADLVTVLANIGIQTQSGANTDINQLLQVLPQLHTGLSVNPRFNGTFDDGMEMAIFRLYNVSLVHGWIIGDDNDPIAHDHVSKYSYEDAQRVLVQSYDIKRNNLQVNDGEQVLEDATYLKSFLARSATQLTDYGLRHLKEILVEKSFAILFRNDHFSTIYKNNGELFTLVTDFGFKDRRDIVWQALKSVHGSQDAFYTGNFIPISLETDTPSMQQTASFVSNPFSDQNENNNNPEDRRINSYQQIENDEELARRLQEEEDRDAAGSIQRNYNRFPKNPKSGKKTDAANSNGQKRRSKRDKLKQKCIVM